MEGVGDIDGDDVIDEVGVTVMELEGLIEEVGVTDMVGDTVAVIEGVGV